MDKVTNIKTSPGMTTASEALVESLIKLGLVFVGEDGMLHVIERENI